MFAEKAFLGDPCWISQKTAGIHDRQLVNSGKTRYGAHRVRRRPRPRSGRPRVCGIKERYECVCTCREKERRVDPANGIDALLRVTTAAFRFLRHSHAAREATCARSLRRSVNRYTYVHTFANHDRRPMERPQRWIRLSHRISRRDIVTADDSRVIDRCPSGSSRNNDLATRNQKRILIRNEIL